jgi:hypothetical protein
VLIIDAVSNPTGPCTFSHHLLVTPLTTTKIKE